MSKHFSPNKKHHDAFAGDREGGPADPVPEAQDNAAAQQDAAGTGAAESETPEPVVEKTAAESGALGPETPAAGQEACPEDCIAALEAQLAEAKDQFLRKAADFENFRKRMNRDKQDAIDFANQNLLLDIIPILDDFDRALQSAENSKDFTALYEGVGMIAKRLSSTLETKWGLKGYVSTGTPFDPNFHEALMMDKSSAVTEQIVQMDLIKGYTLKDRVIRSAKVKVLVPDPAAPAISPEPLKEAVEEDVKPEAPAGDTQS
jgi:molecular chaperone GrpE